MLENASQPPQHDETIKSSIIQTLIWKTNNLTSGRPNKIRKTHLQNLEMPDN